MSSRKTDLKTIWESEFSYLINQMLKYKKATILAVFELLAPKK